MASISRVDDHTEASENAIEEVRDSLWTEVKNIQTSVDDLIVAATQEHRLS